MRLPNQSFYAKLSTIFLVLILALGAGSIIIAFSAARHLFDEVEQALNRDYAASIANEIQGKVAGGFSEERIMSEIHYMMVLNPMVEIYVLNEHGEVISYFTHPGETIERTTIDLAPIKEFVHRGPDTLILGDDPRNQSAKKPFSAAPLSMGNDQGYVYVILRGDSFDRSLASLKDNYYLRTGLSTFVFAVLATLVAGLSLFFLLTRKLRLLSQAVKAFEGGEFGRRVSVTGGDEIGDLGRAFNEMAASIEAGVEKLKLAEQQRSEMIANISHDLRGPLTSIRGNLETVLLKEQSLDREERQALLTISLKNVSSFQKLVEDLFELAKLETRQAEPTREPFQLTELAQDVVLKLKRQAEEAGIELSVVRPGDVRPVNADIGMIERVLTNLLENALRFTPAGGSVCVSVDQVDGQVRARVTDTGSGIGVEDLPHVFERFYRADKARNRSIPGTGLGLAIAKQIVELHGGNIGVESTPGSGSTFTFTL